jgi:hypothetical protein
MTNLIKGASWIIIVIFCGMVLDQNVATAKAFSTEEKQLATGESRRVPFDEANSVHTDVKQARFLEVTLNKTECRGNFTKPKKLYLSDYSDYIMTTFTISIITNDKDDDSTLNTTKLESLMLDSNGDFKASDDDSINPNFPSWKDALPDGIIRAFAQYACQYYNSSQDTYMDEFCSQESNLPSSEFPSEGYIFMRSSEVNRTRRREMAANLCDSIEREWDIIINNMTTAYLDMGLLTETTSSSTSSSSVPETTTNVTPSTDNTTTTTIPIEFFIRTPSHYASEDTATKVITVLENSFNSLFNQIYSRRLRFLQGTTTTDYPTVAFVTLQSMNPVDCNKSYGQTMKCYDVDSIITVNLNNRSAKKLKKKLLQNPLNLDPEVDIFFYNDLNTLQSSTMPSQTKVGLVWGIILSLLGILLLVGVTYLVCWNKKKRKSQSKNSTKFLKHWGTEDLTLPVSPEKKFEGTNDNVLEDMSIEFHSQESPIREYCIDIQSSQRPWNEENPLLSELEQPLANNDSRKKLYTTKKSTTDKSLHSNSSVHDTSKSVAKSVYSAIELVLANETMEPEEKNSTKVSIKDPLVKASSVEVLESSPSVNVTAHVRSPITEESGTTASKSAPERSMPKKKQKSKWAIALDESSGEKYYYNRITKETTWDRPSSFDGDDRDASIPVYPKVYDSVASTDTPNEDPTVTSKKKEIEEILNKISPFEEDQNKILLKTFSGKEDLLLSQLKESTSRMLSDVKSSTPEEKATDGDGDIPLSKVTSTSTNFSMGTQRVSNTSKFVFRTIEDAAPGKMTAVRQTGPRPKRVGSLYNLDETTNSDESDHGAADVQRSSNSFYDDSSVSELSGFTDKSSDESDSTSESGSVKRKCRGKKNVTQIEKKKAQLKSAVHKKDWETASTVAVWLQGLNNRGRKNAKSSVRERYIYSFRSHAELEENFDRLLQSNDMDAIVALIDSMRYVDIGMDPKETKLTGFPKKSLGARSKLQHTPQQVKKGKSYTSRESIMLV